MFITAVRPAVITVIIIMEEIINIIVIRVIHPQDHQLTQAVAGIKRIIRDITVLAVARADITVLAAALADITVPAVLPAAIPALAILIIPVHRLRAMDIPVLILEIILAVLPAVIPALTQKRNLIVAVAMEAQVVRMSRFLLRGMKRADTEVRVQINREVKASPGLLFRART